MKRGHRALMALAIGATVAAGCRGETTPDPRWHDEPGVRWRELDVPRRGRAGFTRMGDQTGITFQNQVSDSALLGNRVLAQGAGVALGDVDADGAVDVFLARTEGCSALYRNLGGWRFENVAERAGLAVCDRYSTGAAFADVEGDGDLDLVLLATKGPNAVFVNDGAGKFSERRDLGLDTAGRGGTTIAMADVDGDAWLDLYVANYKTYLIDDSIPPQQRSFNQMVRQVGKDRYEIVPAFRDYYKLVMRPDMGGLRITARGDRDQFYLNRGGRLERVPLTSDRFRDANGKPLTEEAESFTLGARFADLNGDGAPDLYVANDFEDTDQLWFNDGRGRFRLAEWTSQRQTSNSTMGVDVSDVNGDGRPDIFEVDMLSNDSRRLKTQIPTHSAFPKRPGDVETQLQQQRNALFINRGDETFGETAMYAGIAASGWSWSTMFMDVDLDGWQDVLIATGHLWDVMDADVQERLQNRLTGVPYKRIKYEFPRLALENVAYRNRGDLTFEDVSERWSFGTEEDISHAMAAGDLDGDGDLDVVVNRLGSPVLVLRNEATAPRVAVRLKGDAPNTKAVGSVIRLLGGAVPTQEREVTVGGLYLSHSDYTASFATGERKAASDSATLVVDWRDGRRTVVTGVRPNRLYEITPPPTPATNRPRPPADTSGRQSASAATLFVDATADLAGHTHVDPPFDDWERQFLLPNALSQLGPGVAWFDYDRDGDEDLLIGAGRGGRLAVFRNDGRRLVAQRNPGSPLAPADFTTILGLAEQAGSKLLIGVSSWEGNPGGTLPSAVAVAAGRGGVSASATPLIPASEAATGPMALADYDGDGDLDLFVGSRAIFAQYPRSPSSRLFVNRGGAEKGAGGSAFTLDSSNTNVLERVGLVSAALFSDVDGDGDADLLLAREWGSLLLLLNHGGRFAPAPASWGLDRWTSRWNGLTAGDLDGDGRLDLVATSWGRNTVMQGDSARPLVLLHGPVGAAGEEEPIIARDDRRIGGLAPIVSYARVRVAIPDVTKRVNTFGAYADATIETVLGAAMLRVERKPAVTLDNMVFFNRGGRFEAVAMPTEAQLAPASYAGVADFDGDGSEDVFLTQNFFPTVVGTPRYDAGRGLLLTGDGKGGLAPMPGAASGIRVYGDQRGAAFSDFNADGRLDLVVSQNAAATRLFRNRSARPGLRVRLQGPPSNPDAVGAVVRVVYDGSMGPVREIHAGSGYWSQDGAVQVLGLAAAPTAVWVRWPGGAETRTPVPAGAREVLVRR